MVSLYSHPSSGRNAEYSRTPRRSSTVSDFLNIKNAYIVDKNLLIMGWGTGEEDDPFT